MLLMETENPTTFTLHLASQEETVAFGRQLRGADAGANCGLEFQPSARQDNFDSRHCRGDGHQRTRDQPYFYAD